MGAQNMGLYMVSYDSKDHKPGPRGSRLTDPDETFRGSSDTKHHHRLTLAWWQYDTGPSTRCQAAAQSMSCLSAECTQGPFSLSHLSLMQLLTVMIQAAYDWKLGWPG